MGVGEFSLFEPAGAGRLSIRPLWLRFKHPVALGRCSGNFGRSVATALVRYRKKRTDDPPSFFMFLCGDRYDRYVAMIGQFGRTGRFEDIGEERMSPGEGQDQVDVVIGNELVDRFHKVK